MRSLVIFIALAGCATDDTTETDTLGSGELTGVTWSGGLCQRRWDCVGTLDMGAGGFAARFIDNGELVAMGQMAQSTIDDLGALVAAIPSDTPTGVYTEDGGDGAVWEYRVHVKGETRVYLTKSSFGELSPYVWAVKDSIATCTVGTHVASYSSCTPSR